jgi:hypothetical protein
VTDQQWNVFGPLAQRRNSDWKEHSSGNTNRIEISGLLPLPSSRDSSPQSGAHQSGVCACCPGARTRAPAEPRSSLSWSSSGISPISSRKIVPRYAKSKRPMR